jgi:DNA modification methylase
MILRADARALPLVDGCVDCCVTSPPYFGLRDYGHGDQIGLEGTPEAYVASLVQVFREVRRVLKDSGTCWLNLGDSYAGSWGAQSRQGASGQMASRSVVSARQIAVAAKKASRTGSVVGLEVKAKDMMGIPWRVAFALQADGWYLRSDIIWAKPNPMPESVTDRPTKAHEYLFLLSKQANYHYDAAAIAEPVSAAMLQQMDECYDGLGLKDYEAAGVQNPSSVKARIIANARHRRNPRPGIDINGGNQASERGIVTDGFLNRNRRTVWTVNTQPYSGAHFATMPEALVEPCILAGCPLGGLVLDPFLGSGTVGAVAERLGRRWVGTDLSYQPLAQKRTAQRGIRFEPEEVA